MVEKVINIKERKRKTSWIKRLNPRWNETEVGQGCFELRIRVVSHQ